MLNVTQFCKQLIKAYVAEMSCNEVVIATAVMLKINFPIATLHAAGESNSKWLEHIFNIQAVLRRDSDEPAQEHKCISRT